MPTPSGLCRLCGRNGKLSFEHVPPRRCFNDRPQLLHTLETWAKEHRSPRKMARGTGRYALCNECNQRTGSAYGFAFAQWTYQAMDYHHRIGPGPPPILPFTIMPLRVLKQSLVMVLALSYPRSLSLPHYLALRHYLIKPYSAEWDREFQVWCYFTTSPDVRMTDYAGVLFAGRLRGPLIVYAEIAKPPLGYVFLSNDDLANSAATALGLCNITRFAQFGPMDLQTVHLRLRSLKPEGPQPLTYANE